MFLHENASAQVHPVLFKLYSPADYEALVLDLLIQYPLGLDTHGRQTSPRSCRIHFAPSISLL